MLKELLDFAGTLESEGELERVGFSSYREPLRWTVHIIPGAPPRVHVENPESVRSRPASAKRTAGIMPYPVVDEAGYALGVDKEAGGGLDKRARDKHKSFLNFLKEIQDSDFVQDKHLREALDSLNEVLHQKLVEQDPRFSEMVNKDWVSFVYEGGNLSGQQLFEHDEIYNFWVEHLATQVSAHKKTKLIGAGHCSICGRACNLIRIAPTKIKLFASRRQLMSLNKGAFVSFACSEDDAHLGVCFACGEKVSQSLNYLVDPNGQHQQTLMLDLQAGGKIKNDSIKNMLAVFWPKKPMKFLVEEKELDFNMIFQATMDHTPEVVPTLHLFETFLKTPWTDRDYALGLPDNRFYLAVLSPNGKGRIAVRLWITVSFINLKERLGSYIQALKIAGPDDTEPRFFSIPDLVKALKNATDRKASITDISPNLVRGLLRTAYLGVPPPPGLLEAAVKRLRTPRGRSLAAPADRSAPFHLLAAVLKLALTYGTKEAETMERLDPYRTQPAYLSGRLLAALEEIQRRAAGGKLNATLVDRFYGAAATAPATTFGALLKLAETAHLPKIRRENRGIGRMREILGEIMDRMDEAGGFPRTLSLLSQGEFALGFYHQRAALAPKKTTNEENQGGAA